MMREAFERVSLPSFSNPALGVVEDHWQTWQEAWEEATKRCIAIVEKYRVPVGNSAAGELACEWTMDALREIRDAMRSNGEVTGAKQA